MEIPKQSEAWRALRSQDWARESGSRRAGRARLEVVERRRRLQGARDRREVRSGLGQEWGRSVQRRAGSRVERGGISWVHVWESAGKQRVNLGYSCGIRVGRHVLYTSTTCVVASRRDLEHLLFCHHNSNLSFALLCLD